MKIIDNNGAEVLTSSKSAKKYTKRPISITAVQIAEPFSIVSLEGRVYGKTGDYLIKGTHGEFYICDKKIFEENYNVVW
jgi:hypothetical protein